MVLKQASRTNFFFILAVFISGSSNLVDSVDLYLEYVNSFYFFPKLNVLVLERDLHDFRGCLSGNKIQNINPIMYALQN